MALASRGYSCFWLLTAETQSHSRPNMRMISVETAGITLLPPRPPRALSLVGSQTLTGLTAPPQLCGWLDLDAPCHPWGRTHLIERVEVKKIQVVGACWIDRISPTKWLSAPWTERSLYCLPDLTGFMLGPVGFNGDEASRAASMQRAVTLTDWFISSGRWAGLQECCRRPNQDGGIGWLFRCIGPRSGKEI